MLDVMRKYSIPRVIACAWISQLLWGILSASTPPTYTISDEVAEDLILAGKEWDGGVNGLGPAGQAIGSNNTNVFGANFGHAYIYANAKTTDLGVLPGFGYSAALAINASGQVAGYCFNVALDDIEDTVTTRPFLETNGTLTDLGTLGGNYGVIQSINSSGQMAGYSTLANGDNRAVLCQNGTMTNLGVLPGDMGSHGWGINDSGNIVGASWDSGYHSRAFLYANGNLTNLGTPVGFTRSEARRINNSGQIAGICYNEADESDRHAFLYAHGAMTDLGYIGQYGEVNGLNNSGEIIGTRITEGGSYHAFLCVNGTMYDLNDLLDEDDLTLSSGDAINDSGVIVCDGRFILTPLSAPVVSKPPADSGTIVGGNVTFTVAATGQSVTYFWQRKAAGSSNWNYLSEGTVYVHVNTATLTVHNVTLAMAGDQFRCLISSAGGTTTSAAATLLVGQLPTVSTQPASLKVKTGATAKFTVKARGTVPFKYVWQKNAVNLRDGGKVKGSASASLTLTKVTSADAGNYRVVVANSIGSVTSKQAKLTVGK